MKKNIIGNVDYNDDNLDLYEVDDHNSGFYLFWILSFLCVSQGAKQLGLVDSVPDYEAPVAEVSS